MLLHQIFLFLTYFIFTKASLIISDDGDDILKDFLDYEFKIKKDIEPIKYDLTFTPDFETERFSGKVKIQMKVLSKTQKIILHQNNLDFSKEDILIRNSSNNLTIKKVDYHRVTHLYKITLESELQENEMINITIKYLGVFGKNQQGFYKAIYVEKEGNEKVFGLTQFTPTFARNVFPCMDQPDMKALFTIHIVRLESYTSISSTSLESSEKISDELWQDNFKTTPMRLPTYMIGFVVSQLKLCCQEGGFKVYANPVFFNNHRCGYVLDKSSLISRKIFDKYSIFMLDKIDYVAIPGKLFKSGIVDNFGLIFLNEELIFYKKKLHTALQKQSTLLAISFELVNQWIGHRVTMDWWENIWLNKAIDTYLEYYFANEADLDMNVMKQFVNNVHQKALEFDADLNTKALDAHIGSSTEIEELSHSITYYKGAAILRMVRHFVTRGVFNFGLHDYLDNSYYWGATPSNLWYSIENVFNKMFSYDEKKLIGIDDDKVVFQSVMNRWISNVGYPVVTVEREEDNTVTLSQDRFLSNLPISKDETLWLIPINFVTFAELNFAETKPQFWLTSRSEKLIVNNVKINLSESIILNVQSTGFYRVNYDEKNWYAIIDLFKTLKEDVEKIHMLNRAQLIDDSFNLARAGRINYSIPFNLSLYLQNENKAIPFTSFFNAITYIDKLMGNCKHYNNFASYIKDILKKPYKKFKKKGVRSHSQQLTLDNIIYWLGRVKAREIITDAHEMFLDYDDLSNIPSNEQRQVYCGGMRKLILANTKIKKLYGILNNKTIEKVQKDRALEGLACSLDKIFLWKFLADTINEKNEYTAQHKEDVYYLVIASSNIGVNVAVKFIVDNFKSIKATFGKNVSKLLEKISLHNANSKHALLLSGITDDEYHDDVVKAINTILENEKFYDDKLEVECQRFLELYPTSSTVIVFMSFKFKQFIVIFTVIISYYQNLWI